MTWRDREGVKPASSALLVGLVCDLLTFELIQATVDLTVAETLSFLTGAAASLSLAYHLACRRKVPSVGLRRVAFWPILPEVILLTLMALFLRGGVLTLCARVWGWPTQLAIIPAAISAALINGVCFVLLLPSGILEHRDRVHFSNRGVVLTLAYLFLLRIVYIGQIDLLPQEAYYWNYTQHLDIGYLDHPPMIAWLIWLGTSIFGQNEFGVRIGALVSSAMSLIFAFLLSRNLLGRTGGFRAALLLGTLPFFFGAGALMMPDAPLVATWAASLYFLERALLGQRSGAWWGAGMFLGLGLLSKYPVALLGVASLAFILIDRNSRRWLLRPQPYAAALLAGILFLPVVIWNSHHGWASFMLQGPERWSHRSHFYLHLLIAFVLVLITPLGLVGFIAGVLRRPRGPGGPLLDHSSLDDRGQRFVWVFTLVPLLVFVLQSLRGQSKFNWTGPVWLAAVPAMVSSMECTAPVSWANLILERSWKPTILLLMVLYGVWLQVPVLGLPGVRMRVSEYGMSWRDLGRRVSEIRNDVAARTAKETLVLGMDKCHLSSELSFYNPDPTGRRSTAGWHLLGKESVMYAYWFPEKLQVGKSLVLVGLKREDLTDKKIGPFMDGLEPLLEIPVYKRHTLVGRYYARVATNYTGIKPEERVPAEDEAGTE